MLDPAELIARFARRRPVCAEGTLMFCGTLAARGGVRPTEEFEFELEDPVRGRTITHGYDIAQPAGARMTRESS